MEVTRYDCLNYCAECGELGPHDVKLGTTQFYLCQWCAVALVKKLGEAITTELREALP